jgi:hypothetical protein
MRIALMIMTAFLGVTAVAGGVGLLEGTLSPDMSQLDGSPFGSYTVPALTLLAIGIVSLASATLLKLRHPLALRASATAGMLIIAFEVVQMLYIDFHWLQPAYLVVGVVITAFAAALNIEHRLSQRPEHSNTPLV